MSLPLSHAASLRYSLTGTASLPRSALRSGRSICSSAQLEGTASLAALVSARSTWRKQPTAMKPSMRFRARCARTAIARPSCPRSAVIKPCVTKPNASRATRVMWPHMRSRRGESSSPCPGSSSSSDSPGSAPSPRAAGPDRDRDSNPSKATRSRSGRNVVAKFAASRIKSTSCSNVFGIGSR